MPCVTEPTPWTPTSRRTLGKAAVAATVAFGAVGAAVRLSQDDDPERRPGGALVLSAEGGSDIAELEVPLELGKAKGGVRETESMPTSLYSMVGVTWRGDSSPQVWARARRSDGWTDWTRLPVLEDRPEDDAWQADRRGTAAWWVGPSRAVQVRVAGAAPKGMRLVLLHPAGRSSDLAVENAARRSTGEDDVVAPKPDISSRAKWGADESWRDGKPRYESTIEQVHVHHTASGNDYSRSDTPALIRGMYRYHTKSLGWSDIAYNFLVDRFGRIWEGRAGGIARPVRGAHTLGFNSKSCGIAVIGNFDQVKVPDGVVRAVAAVAAWKLDRYGRRPRGSITVRSEGSDKYRDGAMATLRVIDGHRDTNDTSCPGSNLYKRLPDIRARTHELMTAPPQPKVVTVVQPARLGGAALVGRGLKAWRGEYAPEGARTRLQWLRDGREIEGERSWRYLCRESDLGHTLAVRVTSKAPKHDPVIEVLEADPVRSPVVIDLKTRRRRGRVRAKVTVTSPEGVSVAPGGTVTLSIGNRVVERSVRDLDRAVWFGRGKPLASRATRLVVVYSGDRRFLPREVRRTLKP